MEGAGLTNGRKKPMRR